MQAADNLIKLQNNIKGQYPPAANNTNKGLSEISEINNNNPKSNLNALADAYINNQNNNWQHKLDAIDKTFSPVKKFFQEPTHSEKNENLTEADKQLEQQLLSQSKKEEMNKAGYVSYNKISDIDKYVYKLPMRGDKSTWHNMAFDFQLAGYDLSSSLLSHALEKNPENLYFGNDSQVAEKIKQDSGFQKTINRIITENNDKEYFEVMLGKNNKFDKKDLFFSLHGVNEDSIVKGYRQSNGSYIVKVIMRDTYNYLPQKTNDLISLVVNQAYLAQERGEITPYDIYIEFVYRP